MSELIRAVHGHGGPNIEQAIKIARMLPVCAVRQALMEFAAQEWMKSAHPLFLIDQEKLSQNENTTIENAN